MEIILSAIENDEILLNNHEVDCGCNDCGCDDSDCGLNTRTCEFCGCDD